jgi:mannose-6-phosphate isomerase-like protein (cupin superfamily)
MGHRVLPAGAATWRPSRLLGVDNCDLAGQLEVTGLAARLWRMRPGQANTRHRHRTQTEVYVLLEGTGRLRVDDELLTLEPLSAVAVDPGSVRQPFNDTDADQLWLIFGAPAEPAPTEEDAAFMYPDGPKARPPELDGDASADR